MKLINVAAICLASQAASRPLNNGVDSEIAAQPSIELLLYSIMAIHESSQVSSLKDRTTSGQLATPLPKLYVPATLGINVDVSRGAAGAAVLAHLNEVKPNDDGSNTDFSARLAEWRICYTMVAASESMTNPNHSGCLSLSDMGSKPLPVLHNLRGGEVYVASAWFEHNPILGSSVHAADKARKRIGLVTLAVEAAYPEWNQTNEWFPHFVSTSNLTSSQQSAVLAHAFAQSSRDRLGPADASAIPSFSDVGAKAATAAAAGEAAAAGFHVLQTAMQEFEGGRYSYTTRYKLKHDIEQLEHIAHMWPGSTREWLNSEVLPCYRKVLARIPSTETLSRTTAAAGMSGGQPGGAAAYAARLAAHRNPSEAERAAAIAAGIAFSASSSSGSSGSGSGSSTEPALTMESRPLDSMGLYHFTPEDYADGIGRYYNRLLFRPPIDHALESRLEEASAAQLACKDAISSKRSRSRSNRREFKTANEQASGRPGGLFWDSSAAVASMGDDEEDELVGSGWGACAAMNTTNSPFVMLSETFNGQAIEARYLARSNPISKTPAAPTTRATRGTNKPTKMPLEGEGEESTEAVLNRVVVVDNVLSESALKWARQYLEESTIWYETKSPLMGGYVGAYGHEGLNAPPLLALAEELRLALPQVFQDHRLRFLWAYKYDTEFEGIGVHADRAAVNVNLWITPDDANLDPTRGGLVVYAAAAPPASQANGYSNDGGAGLHQVASMEGMPNVTVPYRANRMVLFNSSLYHRTDALRFKPGNYTRRRINLTFLYGIPYS